MSGWEIAATILVPLLGIISGLLGARWKKALTLLKESSEAVVALGLCGLAMQQALDHPTASDEQRRRVTDAVKSVGAEFGQAIRAATDLFNRSH